MKTFAKKCQSAVRRRVRSLIHIANNPDALFDDALTHLLKAEQIPVIFDVGAHQGESITRYRRLNPKAIIHSFEPDRDNFNILTKNRGGQKNIVLNNVGVSSKKGALTFHHNLKSNTSSFHAVNTNSEWAKNRSARHNVLPEEYTSKTYDVPVMDLDSYAAENKIQRINLLKIDTQGHEDEVLRGSAKLLNSGMIDIVETELIVGDAYVKSLQFYDLEQILIPAGYRFYGIDSCGDRFKTPSLSFNILYVHEKFLK